VTADKKVRMHLLYDFYGQLLTDKQRSFFELYHHDDLSLGEIAEQHGVSRQAVYDILKRAERTLEDLESKLELVARWIRERRVIYELRQELRALAEDVTRLAAELPGGGQAPGGAGVAAEGQKGAGSAALARVHARIRALEARLDLLAGDHPDAR